MKSILTFILSLGFISSFAQWNIATGSIDWTPDSSAGMPAANFYHAVQIEASAIVSIIGGGTLSNDYPLCSPLPMTMQIDLSGGASFVGATAADAITTTGANNWKARFNWVYANGQSTIIGTQNTTIPTGTLGTSNTFTFQVLTPNFTSNFAITLALSAGAGANCPQNMNTSNLDDDESTDGFTNRVLPIQKFELNAELIDKTKSKVSWITLNEVNSSKFEVQRKIGKNSAWDMIASVPASGLTTESKNYNYIDKFNETAERIYYRIKQIDLDGSSKYTDIKSLATRITSLQIDGFPNPVKDQFQLQIYSKKDEKISMDIVDVLGRLVSRETFTIKEGSNTKNLRLGNFVAGTYFIKVAGTDSNESLTVLKVD